MFSASKSGQSKGLPDPQFNYVTALLHGDGTNGAQNNTFLDSSTNNATITRTGTPTQGSFSPYGSLWSNYFNAAPSSLQAPSGASISGTGDFTAECWIFPTVVPATYSIIACSDTSGGLTMFGINANGTIFMGRSLIDVQATTSNSLSYNTWNHIALTRSSGTLKLFINGVQGFSGSITTNYNAGVVRFGTDGGGTSLPYNGYISNFRIIPNSAFYTSAFTPPTAPLTAISGTSLLTCQSNRFIDNSTNAYAITPSGTPSVQRFNPFLPTSTQAYSTSVYGGSAYFGTAGDYLSIPDSTPLNLSGGNYTLEAWIYPSGNYTGYNTIITKRILYSSSCAWEIFLAINTGYLAFFNGTIYSSSVTPNANSWNHIAAVYDGTNINLYLNGVRVLQTAITNTNYGAPVEIGNFITGPELFIGYIGDVRVTKGATLYTTTFTPSTSPLTTSVSSGTVSLLCNMTNGAIYDNAMMNDLVTLDGAQISTSVKKYGTGSLSFNGTTSYLNSPANLSAGFGLGKFTIECWIYYNSVANSQIISVGGGSVTNGIYWQLYGGFLTVGYNGVAAISSYAWTPSSSTWYHLAVVGNSGTITQYINGTSASSASYSTAFVDANIQIGYGGAGYLNGYIDDLRITKGYARYTSNFTPPTTALPNYGN